jgi:hypothetical protein
MSFFGRKRASLILLLVLAAGLALAGAAAAARTQEMACCPAGMESGCTWLGAGDCCPERPTTPPRTSTATPPAAACSVLTLPTVAGPLLALPACALLPGTAPRSLVLRL